jgi:FixJ family two-component response regulator
MKSAAVRTVFIVDDDRGMRQAIQDLVESVGLRAESFATVSLIKTFNKFRMSELQMRQFGCCH